MKNSRKPRPFISQKSVRAALDSLTYSTGKGPANPLRGLQLVDQLLLDPDFPPAVQQRDFAADHILISLIEQELGKQRRNFGLLLPDKQETFQEAVATIRRDTMVGAKELLSWCVLYYRYARIDLNFSVDNLSASLQVDRRTFTRYQTHGIRRLTERLISSEWQARTDWHRQRLLARLPPAGATKFRGRASVMDRIRQMLSTQRIRHIQIAGASGIGKSLLVREIIHELIEAELIDDLIWLSEPQKIEQIRTEIADYVLVNDALIDLREYLVRNIVIVVLDDMTMYARNTSSLTNLLQELGEAIVFFLSRVSLNVENAAHISLSELDKDSAVNLTEETISINHRYSPTLTRQTAREIWELAGGNPRAIQLAAANPGHDIKNIPGRNVLAELFHYSANSLNNAEQRAWFIVSLYPHRSVTLDDLHQIWMPEEIDRPHLSVLVRQHLLESSGAKQMSYTLTTAARRYIQELYDQTLTVKESINQLITILVERAAPHVGAAYEIFEHILLKRWPPLPTKARKQWIKRLLSTDLRYKRWRRLLIILEDFMAETESFDAELALAYGSGLWHSGRVDRAVDVLEAVVTQTGETGDFAMQGRALLEMASALRYQGDYEAARLLLEQATHMTSNNIDLGDRLALERGQIALDNSNWEEAIEQLNTIANPSTFAMMLRAEALLLVGEATQARILSKQILERLDENSIQSARVYSFIGQCHTIEQQRDLASHHFMIALSLLEQEKDDFTLGRVRTNLSALLLRDGEVDEARVLLGQAEKDQQALGDRLGLIATRHNLHVLQTISS